MKKTLKYLSLILFVFVVFTTKVFAADYDISLTSNTVTVGNTVSLRIDGSASQLTGRFNISSSNTSVATVSSSSVWIEKNSESIVISTKAAGTAVITVSPVAGISDANGDEPAIQTKTITITVNAKQTLPAPNTGNSGGNNTSSPAHREKSSNNFLSSITIDGLSLNEPFDKEKLEYTLTIPAETESIKINAQLADSNSKAVGIGEVKVSAGVNDLEIVVTAENGSKRTYKIKATVEELSPIKVKINDVVYTLIRKRSDLPKISEYNIPKDITINENVIEGYFNEKLNYNIVGLKDQKGKINFYIYDNGKYKIYKEHTFNGISLQILDKELTGYKKVSFLYDNDKITSYQEIKRDLIKNTYALDNNDITGNQFYLFYAKNLENGKEELYQYDAIEKTVQRYNTNVLDMYKHTSDTYYQYLLICLLVIVVLFVLLFALSFKKKEHKPKKKTKVKELDLLDE